jgi:ribonuclease HI
MLRISQVAAALSGYAVVTLDSMIKAHSLLLGTSAQKVELIAIIQALQLTAGIQVNIYTDSKYVFTTIHVNGALHKGRGHINSGGKVSTMGRKSSSR